MAEARERIRRDGAFAVRRVGVGSGLFGLSVLFAAYLLSPLLAWNAATFPHVLLVPICALLAATAACTLIGLFLRACLRVLRRLYGRGLGVLARRQ
jgi:hypothetical protein